MNFSITHYLNRAWQLIPKPESRGYVFVSIVSSVITALLVAGPLSIWVSDIEDSKHEKQQSIADASKGAGIVDDAIIDYMTKVERGKVLSQADSAKPHEALSDQYNKVLLLEKYFGPKHRDILNQYEQSLAALGEDFGPDPVGQEPKMVSDLRRMETNRRLLFKQD